MSTIGEIKVELKITTLGMLAIKAINYPRVMLGMSVWVPRWCVTTKVIVDCGPLESLRDLMPPPRFP